MKTATSSLFNRNFILLVILLLPLASKAQDTLVYNDNHTRIVKLLEISLDEIKFREFQDSSEIIRSIPKEEIREIRCATNEKIVISRDPLSARFSDKELKRVNAIKFALFSPVFNNLSFSYERVIHPWLNYQGTISFIGIGHHSDGQDASGFAIRNGIRFFHKPDFRLRGIGMFHPMHGRYTEFEIVFSTYNRTWTEGGISTGWYNVYTPEVRFKQNFINYAFNVNFGSQKILDGGIILDIYAGLGAGGQIASKATGSNGQEAAGDDNFPFTHFWFGKNIPMTFTTGLRIGGIFR